MHRQILAMRQRWQGVGTPRRWLRRFDSGKLHLTNAADFLAKVLGLTRGEWLV
jgi:hypothetical protein